MSAKRLITTFIFLMQTTIATTAFAQDLDDHLARLSQAKSRVAQLSDSPSGYLGYQVGLEESQGFGWIAQLISDKVLEPLSNLELDRNVAGMTELHKAARTLDASAVEDLIAGGADVNALDKVGAAPIHYAAAFNKNPGVVEVLIRLGADPHQPLKALSPLHLAATLNKNAAASRELLEGGAKVDATIKGRVAPIHLAAALGNAEVIAALASGGANVSRDIHGVTPIHIASLLNDDYVIGELITFGADPNASIYGIAPLHIAASVSDGYVIRTLVTNGADVNANVQGWTPLHFAAVMNTDLRVSKGLVKSGASPKAKGRLGITPLYLSVLNENRRVFFYLLMASR